MCEAHRKWGHSCDRLRDVAQVVTWSGRQRGLQVCSVCVLQTATQHVVPEQTHMAQAGPRLPGGSRLTLKFTLALRLSGGGSSSATYTTPVAGYVRSISAPA
jgi:hypothetical protein